MSQLGVDPRMLNDIFYFCKSPATAVSPGVLVEQLKEQCFNQDVRVRILSGWLEVWCISGLVLSRPLTLEVDPSGKAEHAEN